MRPGCAAEGYRWIRENGKHNVLLHPLVMANYLLYEKEFRARPVVMRSQPPGIEIEMTNRCNLACVQCLRSVGLKPYRLGDMDPDNYRRILAKFPYVTNLTLNGFGEPMMYPRFFEIVEYTRRVRPWTKIGIYTNGMLIDRERAERMVGSGLTEVDISLDAASPAIYRRVRRGGRLEVVHQHLLQLLKVRERARARFPLVGLNYVMVNDNEGELVPFIQQAAEFGVDFINCISWAAYDWGFRNRRSKDSYLRELEAGRKRMDQLGVRCKTYPAIDTRWADPERPFFCACYWGEEFRVTYDGHVTLGCCTPFQETYSYGNLLEQNLDDIWNGPAIKRNREMARQSIAPNRTCASCDAFGKRFFAPPADDAPGFVSLGAVGVDRGAGRPDP